MREQYSSYDSCVTFFKNLQEKNPNLYKVEVIGLTHEKREIICVTITNNVDTHHQKPALFYTGTIHAREWVGIELAIAFGDYINEHASYDPYLNNLLNRTTLYMVPCANPDGFEYSRSHFAFWRKNRRKNDDGSYGVDLNRNFEAGYVKIQNQNSNEYSGPHPFSEPESIALRDFFLSHPNISIALDYHSQGNVFFPAHNFKDEDDIHAVDLNRLAANMAEEIRKRSGREYGNHMGKPPAKLISGSGREYYYSKGVLALVVEVGSRNISDYIENMSEHIDENIPALVLALDEARNYSKIDSLPRVQNVVPKSITNREVELAWDYADSEDVFFEIFRSQNLKGFAQKQNRIGSTKLRTFTDRNLESATNYYYFVRAVCKERTVKSPYAQVLTLRTLTKPDAFSKILYPTQDKVGYVGEKTLKNRDHFGNKSMLVGCSQAKGECFGVIGFSLQTVPKNAIIRKAKLLIYPQNRVGVQIERFGEWRVGQFDERTVDSIYGYEDIKNAKMLSYIDRPTLSSQLTQGVWREYRFSAQDIAVLQNSIKRSEVFFKMIGPDSLPLDSISQLMQWDIGYGEHSGGLSFRPMLDISFTIDRAKIEIESSDELTIQKDKAEDGLQAGFDESGEEIFGCMEFDLTNLPRAKDTVISEAFIDVEVSKIDATQNDLRFHLEMIEPCDGERSFEKLKNKKVIERIGYDVSVSDIKDHQNQRFVFNRLAINYMLMKKAKGERILLIISSTSQYFSCKNQSVDFIDQKRFKRPTLNVNYIKKRQTPPPKVTNLRVKLEKNIFKLEWDNPKDEAFKGVLVIKNPFRVPTNPYDGQKLYGGSDNYTYDNFGDKNIHKYFAVFSYDYVPNFSEAVFIEVNKK